AENAGVSGEIVVGKIMENTDYNFGYNAQSGEYVDMMKEGIIDPAKVVKTAIQAAASTAGVLLTTGAVMSEIPEEKPATPNGSMPGMM
ncbi:MAG: chaperonin GroEL, partial [Alphaproteobacteria bacterium]|nr:chaperonin GroEL [Alphaproteobacteria bacterium]